MVIPCPTSILDSRVNKQQVIMAHLQYTLESGIDVGQGITIGPGKFVKNNKRRALDKRRARTKCENLHNTLES